MQAATASCTITHGLDVVVGDVLIAVVHHGQSGAITNDEGFFELEFSEENPTAETSQITFWHKAISPGLTVPSSFTFTSAGGTNRTAVHILQFRGIDNMSIWDVAPSASVRGTVEPGTTLGTPVPLTTTAERTIGIGIATTDNDAVTFSSFPSGYINETEHGTGQGLVEVLKDYTSSGSQTAFNAVANQSQNLIMYHVALKAADTIQRVQVGEYDSGGVSVASATVSLPAAPTAGNLLVAIGSVDKTASYNDPPTGWTRVVSDNSNAGCSHQIIYKISNGTETSVTLTPVSVSRPQSAIIAEYSGVDTLDVTAQNSQATPATTCASGTTAATTSAQALALAFFSSDSAQNVETGRSYSNGFNEYGFTGEASAGTPGTNLVDKALSATGTQTTTFTCLDTGDEQLGAIAVFYKASTGPVITDVDTDESWADGDTGLIITGTGFIEAV